MAASSVAILPSLVLSPNSFCRLGSTCENNIMICVQRVPEMLLLVLRHSRQLCYVHGSATVGA
jgi:hypothetical protein